MGGGYERTMAWEEPAEPPILAAAGAVRWTKRKVVIKGADPCASAVRIDDVRVGHAGGGAGLSAGCDAIARLWQDRPYFTGVYSSQDSDKQDTTRVEVKPLVKPKAQSSP